MTIPWRILFGIDVLLNISGILLDQPWLIQISKPLLMPLLAGWFLAETPGRSGFIRTVVLLALLFSTLGDILLMFEGGLFFLTGLGAFLLAHLCYIGAFTHISSLNKGFLAKQPLISLPFLAYPLFLLWFLWNGISSGMTIPVCLYAGVITIMALSVVNLKDKLGAGHFTAMIAGALLFVLSDSLIAVSKFGQTFAGVRPAIMLTYVAGQYLLIQSAIKWLQKHE
ncbi:MAG TPA: lysoplasmalogenase [Saprospiraceae bacterium]|nr:lysoplasmalogenase [Saprospiraceae bacterium]